VSEPSSPRAGRSLSLVFMGTPEYAAVSLRRLLAGPHRVVAVVTRADKARGRGQELRPSPVKELARSAGIEVLDPPSPRSPEFIARLRELSPDLGVVVAYGRILPPAVLEVPRYGCINAHGSLLPKLRGAAPIERAILAGCTATGVTIMQMSEGLDEGPTISSRALEIGPQMTAEELRVAMAELSAQMLAEAVDRYAAGPVATSPQNDAEATFAPPLRKEEAAIDWSEDAAAVVRRVRAFAPRPGAFTFDGATRLKVLVARVADGAGAASSADAGGGESVTGGVAGADAASGARVAGGADAAAGGAAIMPGAGGGGDTAGTILGDDRMLVACGSGAVELLSVQPEGRRAMSGGDYLRGCRGADPHRRLGDPARPIAASLSSKTPAGSHADR